MTPPSVRFDFSNKRVARLAGWKLAELVDTKQRDQIMMAMGRGAIKALQALLKADQLDGVIGIGGNQGSAIASLAMKSLPIGFPKFLVSTVASGNIRPYIGHKDIAVMFSVADLVGGPNLVSRSILTNAVAALIGMVQNRNGSKRRENFIAPQRKKYCHQCPGEHGRSGSTNFGFAS
jgi:uncharacterized protein (UPF0261 family)